MRYNSVRRTLDCRKNHFLSKQLEINKTNGNLKAKLFRMKAFNTVFDMKFHAGIPIPAIIDSKEEISNSLIIE
jgi:hypothetical protein